jgi:uncharacterized integral membrane protein
MINPDRTELQVPAVIGALLGVVTGYLLWGLIGAVVVSGLIYCLRAFR